MLSPFFWITAAAICEAVLPVSRWSTFAGRWGMRGAGSCCRGIWHLEMSSKTRGPQCQCVAVKKIIKDIYIYIIAYKWPRVVQICMQCLDKAFLFGYVMLNHVATVRRINWAKKKEGWFTVVLCDPSFRIRGTAAATSDVFREFWNVPFSWGTTLRTTSRTTLERPPKYTYYISFI